MKLNEIIENDEKYYLNTFGKRTPVCFERGEGIYLYDTDGNRYTDFFAGIAVNVLGHSNPAIVNAVTEQASKLIHCSNLYYIEKQTELAKMICENSCAEKVFFANSGAEANEGAFKLVRAYYKKMGKPEKYGFICLDKSFHGRTITTATATGQDKYKMPYEPLTPGFKHVQINDIEALKTAIDENTAGIMLEPVQGESGVYPLDTEYAKEVRKICDENDIMLIFDEVQTGVGRTGKLFGYMTLGVEPDVFTLAKALGGGVPIGCVCAKGRITEGFKPGDHGTTFGGNPLACAAGVAALGTVIEKDLSSHAEKVGSYMRSALMSVKEALGIKDIRSRGLMFGIEFNEPVAADVKNRLFEQKWLVGAVGQYILRVLPPLVIEEKDVDEFVKALERSI